MEKSCTSKGERTYPPLSFSLGSIISCFKLCWYSWAQNVCTIKYTTKKQKQIISRNLCDLCANITQKRAKFCTIKTSQDQRQSYKKSVREKEREEEGKRERERVQVGNEVGQQVENENCRCSCCQLYKKDESDDQIQYKLERS